ncbi:SSU ribosomal protein S1p [hydrothermal vent metagenome]|uniref:Small ribosomal subunit protein bS1 n=1 Tax=hydrothermal vent metagenome TaxID=652676 RepID=A0A1W1C8J8_9ZZZZ
MSESFAELFENSIQEQNVKQGALMMGTVVSVGREKVVVNVGLKSEAFIPVSQFIDLDGKVEVVEGDIIEVVLDSIDDGLGHTLLSREKAKTAKIWQELELAMHDKTIVKGMVTGKVKGGLTVDIGIVKAFLPGSLVDIRPVKDIDFLEGQEIEVLVIKMDEVRNNIVISRKAVLQEANSADREELVATLEVGQNIKGIVKNLSDYGAFVDLGGVDGLLHITDISWSRVNHPSEKLNIGDELTVKVLSFDKEKMRVSLGLKQLTDSPWVGIEERYPIGKKVSGVVSNIADYGAFVSIEEGLEGLVHTSELDWTNSNARASKLLKIGQEVDVVILDIDTDKHRISLSIKQAENNPWIDFEANYSKGDKIKGVIKSITDFGLFVGLPGNIDGLIYLADLTWDKDAEKELANYNKGQEVEVVVLNIEVEKERISLGLKQLEEDSYSTFLSNNKKGDIIKGVVKEVDSRGAIVTLKDDVEGYLKANEISEDRVEDATTVLKPEQEIEVVVIRADRKNRSLSLSMKQKDMIEEKNAINDYNSQSNQEGTSSTLGDLLKQAEDNK